MARASLRVCLNRLCVAAGLIYPSTHDVISSLSIKRGLEYLSFRYGDRE